MDYLIRKLTNNDYDEYLNLINQFRKTNFTKDEFIIILNKINLYSEIWVIENNNKLIGTGTIIYEYKFIHNLSIYAHIEDICINDEMRNKGYGKILINYLIEKAKEKDCKKVNLVCEKNITPFYEKCGFEKKGFFMTIKL